MKLRKTKVFFIEICITPNNLDPMTDLCQFHETNRLQKGKHEFNLNVST